MVLSRALQAHGTANQDGVGRDVPRQAAQAARLHGGRAFCGFSAKGIFSAQPRQALLTLEALSTEQ
jgi:hypothetical protein